MFETVGLILTNLKRIRINKLKLPDIAPGSFVRVKKEDIL
jgi:16S rRNA U516 pseudouridylate synthase RsuA-like enzyme